MNGTLETRKKKKEKYDMKHERTDTHNIQKLKKKRNKKTQPIDEQRKRNLTETL